MLPLLFVLGLAASNAFLLCLSGVISMSLRIG
jgi:hypothetical protein